MMTRCVNMFVFKVKRGGRYSDSTARLVTVSVNE